MLFLRKIIDNKLRNKTQFFLCQPGCRLSWAEHYGLAAIGQWEEQGLGLPRIVCGGLKSKRRRPAWNF
jgi:hypothetical protein